MYTGDDLSGFVVDLFTEASKFAAIDEFLIAGNESDHLRGTVYLSMSTDTGAERLVENFEKRWYNRMPLYCTLSPIRDLWSACCRDPDTCSRGGDCNYLHPLHIPREVLEPLFQSQKREPRRESRGDWSRQGKRPREYRQGDDGSSRAAPRSYHDAPIHS